MAKLPLMLCFRAIPYLLAEIRYSLNGTVIKIDFTFLLKITNTYNIIHWIEWLPSYIASQIIRSEHQTADAQLIFEVDRFEKSECMHIFFTYNGYMCRTICNRTTKTELFRKNRTFASEICCTIERKRLVCCTDVLYSRTFYPLCCDSTSKIGEKLMVSVKRPYISWDTWNAARVWKIQPFDWYLFVAFGCCVAWLIHSTLVCVRVCLCGSFSKNNR